MGLPSYKFKKDVLRLKKPNNQGYRVIGYIYTLYDTEDRCIDRFAFQNMTDHPEDAHFNCGLEGALHLPYLAEQCKHAGYLEFLEEMHTVLDFHGTIPYFVHHGVEYGPREYWTWKATSGEGHCIRSRREFQTMMEALTDWNAMVRRVLGDAGKEN